MKADLEIVREQSRKMKEEYLVMGKAQKEVLQTERNGFEAGDEHGMRSPTERGGRRRIRYTRRSRS